MKTVLLECDFCDAPIVRREASFAKYGPRAFCDRQCFCQWRRKNKTAGQKKAEKAAYDREYRARNAERLRKIKADYFQRTYDPVAAAVERKKTMPRHVEYCRRPEYRRKKHVYDIKRRNRLQFGPFADCAILLRDLESEIGKRMSDYEIRLQQGTLNKAQIRKRALYAKNRR
jgi:hypothetical protein